VGGGLRCSNVGGGHVFVGGGHVFVAGVCSGLDCGD